MNKPLCFILMPFGQKRSAGGGMIDFDAVYANLIAPAVTAADMAPLRADEEMAGGIIHKPMFERLILCQYALADLTTANANVFYELGLRHAVRRASTVLVFAKDAGQLPFDVAPLRALPYALSNDGKPIQIDLDREAITKRLMNARQGTTDSPIFQLVENFPDIKRLKTDVFRDRVQYSETVKKKLLTARQENDTAALKSIAESLTPIADQESAIVIDLFLSYRDVNAWEEMIALVARMAVPLAATVMVQEQLALALNRCGRGQEAEQALIDLIASRGPSSETYGILGRVYKDRWEKAFENQETFLASGLLKKAIDAYLKGFEADWRDAYPGINAITLMEIQEPPDPRRITLLPVVIYAVARRVAQGVPDYWDHATLIELSVLAKDQAGAATALGDALSMPKKTWMLDTTARNLRLIRQARERRGENIGWDIQIEETLRKYAGQL